jgi:hypothetical protein
VSVEGGGTVQYGTVQFYPIKLANLPPAKPTNMQPRVGV